MPNEGQVLEEGLADGSLPSFVRRGRVGFSMVSSVNVRSWPGACRVWCGVSTACCAWEAGRRSSRG